MFEIFTPGTVKPEADYLEIERLGAKLGIPVPIMFIEVESKNSNGETVYKNRDRSRTFNRNFWNMVFTRLSGGPVQSSGPFGAGSLSVLDVTNTTNQLDAASYQTNGLANPFNVPDFNIISNSVNLTNGIFVGSGLAAESFNDHNLNALITNGAGAGQLNFVPMVNTVPSYNAVTKEWSAPNARVFNNNTALTITVTETALFGFFNFTNGNGSRTMFERTLLVAPVPILPGGQLTVTYTMTLTFPA